MNLMCWVCDCSESGAERVRSGDITAIAPAGACRFCGRTYDEANTQRQEAS